MSLNQFIETKKNQFSDANEYLVKEYNALRTGRASAALVEDIMVEAYSAMTPLKQLASISIPDAKSIVIQPWDKSVLKDIEKAISVAGINVNPINDGTVIRINMTSLTEEDRKKMVKLVNQKAEEAKVKIRQVRESIREDIINAEKNKEIGEDDKYKFLKDLDEFTQEEVKKITNLAQEKEKEVMTI